MIILNINCALPCYKLWAFIKIFVTELKCREGLHLFVSCRDSYKRFRLSGNCFFLSLWILYIGTVVMYLKIKYTILVLCEEMFLLPLIGVWIRQTFFSNRQKLKINEAIWDLIVALHSSLYPHDQIWLVESHVAIWSSPIHKQTFFT